MTAAPPVSVVITTYNRSTLVGRAVDSVLRQTAGDLELIVVNDCSTDDTAEVVSQIRDERLTLVNHATNVGLAEARNSGIRRARGEYVCFLDDDDEWLPDKLLTQVDALSAEPDAARVLSYTQAIVDDGISHDVRPVRGLRPGEPLAEYLMRGEGLVPIQSVMVTTELANRCPFPAGQRRLEDYSWYLRLAELGVRFVLIERPLIVWHVDIDRTRLSRDVSFAGAEAWLQSCGDAVTRRARRAFLAREIAPFVDRRGARLKIVSTIATAVVTRAIPLQEGVKSLAKTALPPAAILRLRRLFPRSRLG